MSNIDRMEADISHAIVTFEKQHMGRGPSGIRTHIVGDMVIVRLQGILTPAEKELVRAGDLHRGTLLIKSYRTELLEKARPHLDHLVEQITGEKVFTLHTDVSTTRGERVIVFVLEKPVNED